MPTMTDSSRNLLFGLLALQNGLISQVQLVAAFQTWTLDRSRGLADHLICLGHLNEAQRAVVEAMADLHVAKHGGVEHSLATIPTGRSTCESLARLGDRYIEKTLAQVRSRSIPQVGESGADCTITYAVGTATSDGERFRILRPHAQGGLGAVFVALDTELHREVALKQMLDRHADDPISRQRFIIEAEITGGLEHPGIVPVYGMGSYGDGRPFYAMRFIEGDSLKEAIDCFHKNDAIKSDPGRLSLELRQLLRRFTDVCNAIEYAHSRGVLHRDIKPGNIIVGKHGQTLVVDWGLAKVIGRTDPAAGAGERTLVPSSSSGSAETLAGTALGTPAYMSPEQAEGHLEHLGPRSDVYSLGATLYYLLTGHPPFEGDVAEVLRAVQRGDLIPPRKHNAAIDRAVEAVCLKAMARRPEDRYATPRALADDLEQWMADEPVSAWREPWAIRARRWVVRHRTPVSTGVAALAVAVVGLAATLAVQARANRDLLAALHRESLARDDASTQSKQAEAAIESLYTGITEDVILRRPELEQLRGRLLGAALQFYEDRVNYLSKASNGNFIALRNIAAGLSRIASLQSMLGKRDAAIGTRRRLVDLYEANPVLGEWSEAAALLELGNLERLAGRPEDAERSLRQALDAYEQIKDSERAALTMADLGRLLVDTGKANEGRQMLHRAQQAQETLVAASPKLYWRRGDLAATYTTLGNLYEGEGLQADALGLYEKAAGIYQEIIALGEKSPFYQAELARSLNNVGLAKARTGKLAEGRHDVERGQAIRERLLADQPLNIERRADLARSAYHLTMIHILMGAPAEAMGSIRKAEELYAGIPPKGPEDLYFRACMKALRAGLLPAGEAEAEEAPPASTERQLAGDQAIALLKQAVRAGYANPDHLRNDPALESVRSRADFQELHRSLRQASE